MRAGEGRQGYDRHLRYIKGNLRTSISFFCSRFRIIACFISEEGIEYCGEDRFFWSIKHRCRHAYCPIHRFSASYSDNSVEYCFVVAHAHRFCTHYLAIGIIFLEIEGERKKRETRGGRFGRIGTERKGGEREGRGRKRGKVGRETEKRTESEG